MQIRCLIKAKDDLKDKEPKTKEELNKFTDNSQEGIWKGWGYFYSTNEESFQSKDPVFISLMKSKISLKQGEKSIDSIYSIELKELISNCDSGICNLEEFDNKKDLDNEIQQSMGKVEIWLSGTDIKKQSACFVLEKNEEKKNKRILCIYNQEQTSSFKLAIDNSQKVSKANSVLESYEPLQIGAEIEGIFLINSNKYYEGKAEIGEKFIKLDNGLNILKFSQIESINGDSCEVLISKFYLPEEFKLTHKNININCCSQSKLKGMPISICLINDDCVEINKKLAKRIRVNCENQRKSLSTLNNDYDYNKDTVDKHEEGSWFGWIRRVILSNNGSPDIVRYPEYLKIDKFEKKLSVGKTPAVDQQNEIKNILDLKWECKGEMPCSIKEFAALKDIKKFEVIMEEVLERMKIENSQNCFILGFNNNQSNSLICVIDINQLESIKLALVNSYNKIIKINEITEVPLAEEGDKFHIKLFNALEKDSILKTEIQIQHGALFDLKKQENIIEFSNIEPYFEIICGLEFRKIELPSQITQEEGEIDPNCCFAYKSKKLRNVLCIDSNIRCIAKSRMLMKKVHQLCLDDSLDLGIITEAQYSSTSLKEIVQEGNKESSIIEGIVEKKVNNNNDIDKKADNDKMLIDKSTIGQWKGKVFYKKIITTNDLEMSNLKGGFLDLDNKSISFFKNFEELSNGSQFKFNILESYFSCSAGMFTPCAIDSFLKIKKLKLNDMDYMQLNKQIKDFIIRINSKSEICSIVEFQNPVVFYFDSFIICPLDINQGQNLRKAISVKYNQEIDKVSLKDQEGSLEFLPEISPDLEFETKIYFPVQEELSERKIKVDNFKIYGRSEKEVLLRFENIDSNSDDKKCKILETPQANLENNKELLEGIDKTCCFSLFYFEKEAIYCPKSKIRCKIEKLMLLKHISTQCKKLKGKLERNDDSGENNKENIKDSFDFGIAEPGLSSKNKLFNNIDPKILIKDTINDAENGNWKGWVLRSSLTERDRSSLLTLQYISLDSKFLKVFKNKDDLIPFKNIKLETLYWPCIDLENMCNPLRYLKIYKKSKNISFEASHELSITIKNLIEQLPQKNPNNCLAFDIEDPVTRTYQSEFICAFDEEQIKNLQKTFNIAYYQAILNSEILSDVPLISYSSENFIVKILDEGQVKKSNNLNFIIFFNNKKRNKFYFKFRYFQQK